MWAQYVEYDFGFQLGFLLGHVTYYNEEWQLRIFFGHRLLVNDKMQERDREKRKREKERKWRKERERRQMNILI